MSNCHKRGNNKTVRQKSTDSKCFLRFFKTKTEDINQTIIFNCIFYYFWLFIVMFFNNY